jgi:hypothetical protein
MVLAVEVATRTGSDAAPLRDMLLPREEGATPLLYPSILRNGRE